MCRCWAALCLVGMQAPRVEAARIVEAFDSVPMEFSDSMESFGYGGGRDLSRLAEDARSY
jgi:hypothetical protein